MTPPDALARDALAALDRALAARPATEPLGEVLRRAAALRDALSRAAAPVDAVNAVITLALSVRFPLGEPPWPTLVLARDALAEQWT